MKLRLIVLGILLASMLVFAAEGDEKEVRIKSKKQGWLGVGIQDVTPTFAREHELKIKEGAYINEIVDDSPADSAGLKEGDVVVEFNGKKIEAAEDLTNAVLDTAPGTKAGVKIIRSGENKTISVNIGRNKMRMPFGLEIPRSPRVIVRMFGGDIEGMELMELNKQLGEYFEAPGGKGVLVKEVEKEENAAKAGIKAGDVITKVGDETIKDNEDIRDAISELKEGDKVNIELLRNLFMDLIEENPEIWTPEFRDELVGIMREAVALEKEFIRDCLPVNAVGLSAHEFEQYTDYIADRRLAGCGLPALNPGITNPLPWLAEMMDVRKEQNFFEGKVTDYQKSSALATCSDDDL